MSPTIDIKYHKAVTYTVGVVTGLEAPATDETDSWFAVQRHLCTQTCSLAKNVYQNLSVSHQSIN